jgi:hypothetical protein
LKFIDGNKNELDPRSWLQQKKLIKLAKNCLSSAKPELAILKVNWACARMHWAALGEPTSYIFTVKESLFIKYNFKFLQA